MSQLFSYFKTFFHPNANQDRKRRRNEPNSEAPQFPKYRRVQNIFPKRYNHRIDDEPDHFQQVRQNRQNYNDILESFLMEQQNQQRKQYRTINDEEFSDEDDVPTGRIPGANSRNLNSRPSTSGYKFTNSPPSTSYNFSQPKHYFSRNETHFASSMNKAETKQRRMPELVPIVRNAQPPPLFSNNFTENGYAGNNNKNQQQRGRRSILDFTKKNRAFNDSSNFNFKNSVLDRNHNIEVKNKYESLLNMLIPRFAQKSINKFTKEPQNFRDEPIQTVDLSSDENDTEFIEAAAAACGLNISQSRTFQPRHRSNNRNEFKKATKAFIDLSDDEVSEQSFVREGMFSSTRIHGMKGEQLSPTSSQRKSESSSIPPNVTPVNSLKERQMSRNCLQSNVIDEIVKKYESSKKSSEYKINAEIQNLSMLTVETAEQEKEQQRRIDDTVSSLQQCIILDDAEEAVNEFPPLTDRQLQIVRFGLQGPRNEVIASKFNMNITRHDLNTLDGMNWLNDEVINFYMEMLRQRSEDLDHLPKVHAMNTFFLVALQEKGYSGVRRWTRKVDIFSKDIIPVPVHVSKVHWCMSIIHMRNKTIRYYDSMGHANNAVLDALREYLKAEHLDKKQSHFDMSEWTAECVLDCPQQRNGSDCGVFSCMFAEFICRDSKISFEQQHMQYFRRKMVFEIGTGQLLLGY